MRTSFVDGPRALKTLYFHFCKVMKNKNNNWIFAKNFARNCEKKIILGTSDAIGQ